MISQDIEQTMRHHLAKLLPHHAGSEIYTYATLPGGKLFRPHLVWSTLKDLNSELYLKSIQDKNSAHALLATAVEFHHSYTLIHDDLPSMDNDTVRRGKPCTHLAYGEWQALLAGDGLLNLSYQLLSKIKNERTLPLMKFFSWALGPKGLIHGQVMDLSHEMTVNLENTIRTHELKTARLIQVAILGSAILASKKDFDREKKLWKYSRLLGINFQLIDDLSELSEAVLSDHEKDVSPWLHHPQKTLELTVNGLKSFADLSSELRMIETNSIVKDYYSKMLKTISENQNIIEGHLNGKSILPVILLLKSFGN
jgi:geranylgeranyl pyrophosphate synthase